MSKNISTIPSPAYVLEESKLVKNLERLQYVQQAAEVEIILALKAFALWKVFPLIAKYLAGATASSLNEILLINKHFKTAAGHTTKAHTYAPAYMPADMDAIIANSSHITFNSLSQYRLFAKKCIAAGVSIGLRVNPEISTVETDLYNPAAKGSRLGETSENLLEYGLPKDIEGLHFHVLCESTSHDLQQVLNEVERRFGAYLPQLKWLNMGGGHLITRKDYDPEHLIAVLKKFKHKYPNLQLILEPGSAIAWETGLLVTSVLDKINNHGIPTAILDTSFTCHMPDTLEMPYRPNIIAASKTPIAGKPTYRLGGVSCLAGDYLGAYSFEQELEIGDRVVFQDMLHYTTVKTTMFNGVQHPSIYIKRLDGSLEELRAYVFEDYERRMC